MKYCYDFLIEYLWHIVSRKWTASPSPHYRHHPHRITGVTGKLGQWPWLTLGSVKRHYEHAYVKNRPRVRSQDLKKPLLQGRYTDILVLKNLVRCTFSGAKFVFSTTNYFINELFIFGNTEKVEFCCPVRSSGACDGCGQEDAKWSRRRQNSHKGAQWLWSRTAKKGFEWPGGCQITMRTLTVTRRSLSG